MTALLYLPRWNRAHPCVSSCGTFPFSRSLSCLGSLSFLCPAMSCNLLKNTACIKPCLNSAILQGGKAHSRAWATQPARQGLGGWVPLFVCVHRHRAQCSTLSAQMGAHGALMTANEYVEQAVDAAEPHQQHGEWYQRDW